MIVIQVLRRLQWLEAHPPAGHLLEGGAALAVGGLIAILIGAELVGILGALAAIPVARIIRAIAREVIRWRREAILPSGVEVVMPDEPESS